MINAINFIQQNGVDKAREVVEGAPSNAESYQDGYYFRTKPEFQFHNGFHPVWNLTDNDGEYFKKRGFSPAIIEDLKRLVSRLDLIDRLGGINKASDLFVKYQHLGESCFQEYLQCSSRTLEQAIADYELIYKCTYCNGFGEVGCQFEGTFTCPDCNGDRYVGGEHV